MGPPSRQTSTCPRSLVIYTNKLVPKNVALTASEGIQLIQFAAAQPRWHTAAAR